MSIDVPLGVDVNLRLWLAGLTDETILIGYGAENVSESDLYLFNRLFRPSLPEETIHLDSNLVYVNTENDLVHITKRIPDVPDDMDVFSFIVPCATILPRGETTQETIQLALPLQNFNPYLDDSDEAVGQTATQDFHAIAFSLGYFRTSELGGRPVSWIETTEGSALHVYVSPLDQLIARSSPISVRVPVRI